MAKELGEPSEASADPGGDAEVGRFLAKQQRCDFFGERAIVKAEPRAASVEVDCFAITV